MLISRLSILNQKMATRVMIWSFGLYKDKIEMILIEGKWESWREKIDIADHLTRTHNRVSSWTTWYKLGLPQRHLAIAPEKPSVPLINCRTVSRYWKLQEIKIKLQTHIMEETTYIKNSSREHHGQRYRFWDWGTRLVHLTSGRGLKVKPNSLLNMSVYYYSRLLIWWNRSPAEVQDANTKILNYYDDYNISAIIGCLRATWWTLYRKLIVYV